MSASARIDLVPHCSLTPRGAVVFFASVCAVSFGIAGLLAAKGFWPVLPFAGLEMAVLGWALRDSMARRHYCETIVITESDVEVEARQGAASVKAVFPRHWAQVKLRSGLSPLHPSRLVIESHGRRREIGSFLTEQERLSLAARLRRLVGRVNESPTLAP